MYETHISSITVGDIERVLDELRPSLQAHGGEITCLAVNDDGRQVVVAFRGACLGCPVSAYTFSLGIEHSLKKAFPVIETVTLADDMSV